MISYTSLMNSFVFISTKVNKHFGMSSIFKTFPVLQVKIFSVYVITEYKLVSKRGFSSH